MFKFSLVVLAIALFPGRPKAQELRQRQNFDAGWKFFLGDDSTAKEPGYNDAGWRTVDLPHDWSIEGDFNKKHATGQQEGGLPAGIGWYRKTFRDQPAYIDFDGVYRNSEVWINGHYLGKRPNGYISFRYELTPWLKTNGQNVLAVRVDNSKQPNSRWYSGSGIYRHVWIGTRAAVALDQWGIFVTTPEVSQRQAIVEVNTTLWSDGSGANRSNGSGPNRPRGLQEKRIALYDSSGRKIAVSTGQRLIVPKPHLWSPDHPYLYTVQVQLLAGDKEVDRYTVTTGIRYFHFDAARGFLLNGQPLKIRGVCLHHDLGALGAAVNTSAMRRQLQLLKEMGCNGIRTAHNPPAPEFLDLCDQMGFIVMDEAFDMWRKKKNKYDYSLDFPEWSERDLRDQVKRDRNHPSVFLWSIGNEIREQFDSSGIPIAQKLAAIVKKLDPTRPVTSALTETDTAKNFIYRSGALDLMGLNYNEKKYDSIVEKYPGHPFLASETTSALATRGHYDPPSDSTQHWPTSAKAPLVGNDDYTVSAYDNVAAYWGSTHEETWKAVKRNPVVSGLYVWTGFDYLGEPSPYPWPARSSYFGILDLAGFPKDVYYMYQSEWLTKPILHLVPQNWNWQQGQTVDVWAYYSGADEVELFLNGQSLGIRKKEREDLHVGWRVAWSPGVLKAVSRRGGKNVLISEVRTAGAPASIQLSADRKIIRADGVDLSFLTARITDSTGQLVPDAANELAVTITGEGELAGMDNGYQADLTSFRGPTHAAYNGLCLAIVRAKKRAGRILVHVSGKGLEPADLEITTR